MTTTVRIARPQEAPAIAAVHRAAFPSADEARLVEAIGALGDGLASIVAVDDGVVVGHVLFSRMRVVGPHGVWPAVALAPVAVTPDRQRRGIAAAMIDEGLRICREADERVVFVLGDPAYYHRFGFRSAPAAIESPWPAPHFMALALAPGGLDGIEGRVRYSRAFGLPD